MILLSLAGCGNESSSSLTANGTTINGLTAEAILRQMRQTYASCNTYQDSGVVNVTYNQNSVITSRDEISFLTAFVRPDRFRFEYKDLVPDLEPRYIIWGDGSEVLSWWDINPGIRTEDSLSIAIAGATGVSEGSAATIPSLLISDQVGLYFDITESQRLDDDSVNGFNCYRIYGMSGGDPITLWIDTKTFLIQRIKSLHTSSPNYSYEIMTTYTPLADGDVTDAMLAFNPPQ